MDGQTARRSRPVQLAQDCSTVPRTTNHSRTKPIGFVTTGLVSTIQSHGLEHLIDPDYVVKDAALDQLQRCWLYKILQDIMQAPCKAIVVRHLKDRILAPYGRRFSLTTTTP
jgi:hypothetical protein